MDALSVTTEISLDPEDWDALRALGRRMVDDIMTYLETVRERPVWQPVPEAARARLAEPLPRAPPRRCTRTSWTTSCHTRWATSTRAFGGG